jgi:hypothetical protein
LKVLLRLRAGRSWVFTVQDFIKRYGLIGSDCRHLMANARRTAMLEQCLSFLLACRLAVFKPHVLVAPFDAPRVPLPSSHTFIASTSSRSLVDPLLHQIVLLRRCLVHRLRILLYPVQYCCKHF